MRCDRRQFRINYWQFNRLIFMRRDISNEVKTNQLIDRSTSTQQFGILNVNVKRVSRQPVQMMMLAMVAATRTQGGDITGAEITVLLVRAPSIASLSLARRDLYQLWNEYLHGIRGRKPANHFSLCDRGRVKHTYDSLCNNFWQIIVRLVGLGYEADVAIDQIYLVYGAQTSVTKILTSLRKDKQEGWKT